MNKPTQDWLIDLGNSRLKVAPLAVGGARGAVHAIAHARDESNLVADLFTHLGDAAPGARVWLASVASSALTATIANAVKTRGFSLHRVCSAVSFGKLRIAYPEPTQLGVDRFLALLAASERNDGPWLIVSIGSALTVDLLDTEGRHVGGLIAATPTHMREALALRFPVLDLAEGVAHDFADNSADAVASGCNATALGLIELSLQRAQKKLGRMPTLLLTGGGAAIFAELIDTPIVHLPALVLDGLAIVARAGAQ